MLVEIIGKRNEEKLITTSLQVAEVFEKEHARVLRDIRELSCSEDFRNGNFAESSYINSQNKKQPMYPERSNKDRELQTNFSYEYRCKNPQ